MGGDDIMHYYWGGAHNKRGFCACGVKNNCRNNKKYCNCDDLDAFNMVMDEGTSDALHFRIFIDMASKS